MQNGTTREEMEVLLNLSDIARRAAAQPPERTCEGLFGRGLLTRGSNGEWYLSRAGWEAIFAR